MTIKRHGAALYRQVPGWFAQAIFPESETVFFNATEDEQLTFIKNDKEAVTGVIVEEIGTFGDSGRKEFKRGNKREDSLSTGYRPHERKF